MNPPVPPVKSPTARWSGSDCNPVYQRHSDERRVEEIKKLFNKARKKARKELRGKDRDFPRPKKRGRTLSSLIKNPRHAKRVQQNIRNFSNPFGRLRVPIR